MESFIKRLIVPEDIDFGAGDIGGAFIVELTKRLFEFLEFVGASGGASADNDLIIEVGAVFFIQVQTDDELFDLPDAEQMNAVGNELMINITPENGVEYISAFREIIQPGLQKFPTVDIVFHKNSPAY